MAENEDRPEQPSEDDSKGTYTSVSIKNLSDHFLYLLKIDSDKIVFRALKLLAIGVAALVTASISAHIFLFHTMTSGLKGQFKMLSEQVTGYSKDVSGIEEKIDANKSILDSWSLRLERIESNTSASSSVLFQVREGELKLPSLTSRLVDLDLIGGPDSRIQPDFIPMENWFNTSIGIEELEREKTLLKTTYESLVRGQSIPKFDPDIHKFEVIHTLMRNNRGETVVYILAYVAYKDAQ